MKILFISDLEAKVSSGMSWSVPARIAAQARIDDVLWVNLSNVSMPHWEETGVYHEIKEYGKLDLKNLPNGFDKPELVVFEGVYYIKFVWFAKKLRNTGIPYIVVPRSMLTESALHNGKYWKKMVANYLFFNTFIKKALAIQYLTKKEHKDSGDRWNERYIICPNGIDVPNTLIRKDSNDGIDCIFIGRLDIYQKGLDLLINACSKVQGILRKEHFLLTLYGPDWQGSVEKLTNMINERNIADIIKLGGEIKGKTKADCLSVSNLFVMTSRFEGMPMGLIEALAYGVPALLAPGSNFCDEIEKYNAGWTCGESEEEISRGLLKMLEQKTLFKEKSIKARELALKYKWDDIALQFNRDVKQYL